MKLFLFFISIILFVSCERNVSLKGREVNTRAGKSRNYNYEDGENFYKQYFEIEKLKTTDNFGLLSPILALSSFEYIIPTDNGKILYYNNKEIKWEITFSNSLLPASSMCADKEQNIYIVDTKANFKSFSINGKLRWSKNLFEIKDDDIVRFQDLLCDDEGIYVSASNGYFAKFDFNGSILWSKWFNLSTTDNFTIDESDNIIYPLTHNLFGETDTLIYLNKKGEILWSKKFDRTRIIKPPVAYKDKVYLCCVENNYDEKYPLVYILNNKGKVIRKIPTNFFTRFLTVDSDENVYTVSYESGFGDVLSSLICWDKNGKKLWDKHFELAIVNPIIIGPEALIFLGAVDKAYGLYVLDKKGNLLKVIQLADAPTINLIPEILPGNMILFGMKDEPGFVRIQETPMNKYLPW